MRVIRSVDLRGYETTLECAVPCLVLRDRHGHATARLFLCREVLDVALPWLDDLVWPKRPQRLPVVLTYEEVRGRSSRTSTACRG
jgi:hypothetical protein